MAGAKKVISLRSSCKEEAIDITDLVNQVIKGSGIKEGILFFVRFPILRQPFSLTKVMTRLLLKIYCLR